MRRSSMAAVRKSLQAVHSMLRAVDLRLLSRSFEVPHAPVSAKACIKVSHFLAAAQLPDGAAGSDPTRFLALPHKKLSILPPAVALLHATLTHLCLSGNKLVSLPDTVAELRALQCVWLADNRLEGFPACLTHVALTVLVLANNPDLQTLPCEIRHLGPSLSWLDVSTCGLTALPAEVGCLHALRHLEVHGNRLTSLPAEIGACRRLDHLACHSNLLVDIPSTLRNLNQLSWLSLHANALHALPNDTLGALTQLRRLSLHRNGLGTLPPDMRRCVSLCAVSLFDNHIRDVSVAAGWTDLVRLGLMYNDLPSFPLEVCGLHGLQHLMLHGNPGVDRVPAAIQALTALREIWLDATVADLASLTACPQLTTVWISGAESKTPVVPLSHNFQVRLIEGATLPL
jgi:leucine-rich repeat protein SHOC2